MLIRRTMLLIVGCLFLAAGGLSGCMKIPFLPRRNIDTFHADIPISAETMEVNRVIYVRVINPGAGSDEDQPPTRWIPLDEFRRGSYQLPAADSAATTAAADQPAGATTAAPADAVAAIPEPAVGALQAIGGPSEETLAEAATEAGPPPPLRRRAAVLPGSVTTHYPAMVSQLTMEMEDALPLQIAPPGLIPAGIDAWQRNGIAEQREAVRTWLAALGGPPPVQFVILFSVEQQQWDRRFRVVLLDAQTTRAAASFTCRFSPANAGQRLRLLPAAPIPLITLLEQSPWWCRVYCADGRLHLGAGRRSGLTRGRRLELRPAGGHITDPDHSGEVLGYAFGAPFAEVVVGDWFGADGAIGTVLPPGTKLPAAGAYAVLPVPAAPTGSDSGSHSAAPMLPTAPVPADRAGNR
ncbi:MAG: hypothetical protein JW781_07510 [Deltaproteobacteria bacterium]|nr:hypothetical protein [Candidatus Anaeroferrophillacea bacterium]